MNTSIQQTEISITLPSRIRSKQEITNKVKEFEKKEGKTSIKFLAIKEIEEFCKQFIERNKKEAKQEFLEEFGGSKLERAYGVKVEIKDYSRANNTSMERPRYDFSQEVFHMEQELKELEKKIKAQKEALVALKLHEIQNGTAQPLSYIFGSEQEEYDDLVLTITLEKE